MAWSNTILFGESGGGKGSIVNMLSGGANAASTSGGARGHTYEGHDYDANILGEPVTLWDTAGLDEGDADRLPRVDAICQLCRLLRSLSDGVSLLVFVMRGPRITGSASVNWKVFQEVICRYKVPVVLLITWMEDQDDGGAWWWQNKGAFQDDGILPAGFACITATRGKKIGEEMGTSMTRSMKTHGKE